MSYTKIEFNWIENQNGNLTWTNDQVHRDQVVPLRCTVYLKKGTKTSWRWVINHRGSTYHSDYVYSKNKAKQDAEQYLFSLANGVSWSDARA